MGVEFITETEPVPAGRPLESLAEKFFCKRGIPAERQVCVIFLDDAGITVYNRQFFDKDTATDVISVNLDEELDGEYLWGEIYVSIETARREAEERGLNWEHELLLYVTHGLLHLDGCEDGTPEERQAMWLAQLELLGACGYDAALFGEVA